MKYVLFFLLFLPSLMYSKSIILNIDSKFNIPSDFREVIESNLEDDYKYNLKEMIESDSLDIETKNSGVKCHKDKCYQELGKKFKADYLLNIQIYKITRLYSSKYKVKVVLINLKSVNKIKKLFYYRNKLSDIDNLRVFAENLMIKFFDEVDKERERRKTEELNKIPKTLTKKNILTMIREVYPEIKKCGRDNDYSGIVKVKFKIKNDGSITDVKFITDVTDIIKDCIYNSVIKMKTIKFRSKAITINFPLKLD